MTKEQLFKNISEGHEIEFEYNGKKYSITYSPSWENHIFLFVSFISIHQMYKPRKNLSKSSVME